MILLLDSTVLIDLLRNRNNRRELIRNLVLQGNNLATTAINVAEVYAGMRTNEAAKTDELFAGLEIYEMDMAIAKHAGQLVSQAARKGRTFSLADMIVAATALEYGLTLMTDNDKDFRVPELQLFPL